MMPPPGWYTCTRSKQTMLRHCNRERARRVIARVRVHVEQVAKVGRNLRHRPRCGAFLAARASASLTVVFICCMQCCSIPKGTRTRIATLRQRHDAVERISRCWLSMD